MGGLGGRRTRKWKEEEDAVQAPASAQAAEEEEEYRLGVAHFSMLQALETLIFSYSLFCVLILIPP